MVCDRWLELRSGAPALGCAFLTEHRSVYEVFENCNGPAQMILAVGGTAKRRYLRSLLPEHPWRRHDGVSLRPLSSTAIVVDCELHNLTGRDWIEAKAGYGNLVQHRLCSLHPSTAASRIQKFARDLYWQVMVPFCPLILLFQEDFGGLSQVLEALVEWARLVPAQCAPRVAVVHSDTDVPDPAEFSAQLRAKLTDIHDVSPTGSKPFESLQFLPASAPSEALFHSEVVFELRDRSGFGFSGEHTTVLLQEAVRRFAKNMAPPFNFYDASRVGHPVPNRLQDHITAVLRAVQYSRIDRIQFIASALVFNAYPPGMHFFLPPDVFDRFYHRPLATTGKILNQATLAKDVRNSFVEMATQRRRLPGADAHLQLLQRFEGYWRGFSSTDTCLVCAVQSAASTLTCQHRLCDACAVVYGSSQSSGPWRYEIARCPLCREVNKKIIQLKPPTAGLRILCLEGTVQGRYTLLRFLKELKSYVGITSFPLREHFDLVAGSDIGAYFINTIFLERWSLEDCRYHLGKVRKLKVCKKSSTVTFGKGLEWDFSGSRLSDGVRAIFRIQGHTFSNTMDHEELIDLVKRPTQPRYSDIVVRYQGGVYRSDLLRSIGSRLCSYLFYIELRARPRFYAAPELIQFQLCCRLPAGPPLRDLIFRLHRRNARVRYRADKAAYFTENLVTEDSLAKLRKDGVFKRILKVKATSMKSRLDVRIDGVSGDEGVSNCPYKLQKLVEDQGLDCTFGRKDYQNIEHKLQELVEDQGLDCAFESRNTKHNVKLPSKEAFKEIERLQGVLDEMLSFPI